nr:hypothetical protein [Sodalis glossinidius]
MYPKVDGTGDADKVANQFIEKTGSGAAQRENDGAVWYLLDC